MVNFGDGFCKTYKESRYYECDISSSDVLMAYKNAYFIKGGRLIWASDEDEYNEYIKKYKRVEILNVIYLDGYYILIEFIDQEVLYNHLMEESIRNSECNDVVTGKIPVDGLGFHKTYFESVIRRVRSLSKCCGELFMCPDGNIVSYYEISPNIPEYRKIELLKFFQYDSNFVIFETIDSSAYGTRKLKLY